MSGWVDMRLKQSLTASLPGDQGAEDAMVQWLDYEVAHVLTRERLPMGKPVRLYLEVPPQQRLVELVLEIQEIARPGSSATRGWLHRAKWKTSESDDDSFIQTSLRQLNPSARKTASWASQHPSAAGSTPTRSKASSSSLSSGGRRRQQVTPPQTSLSPASAGSAPYLLVQFSDPSQLGTLVDVDATGFWLRLELEATLPVGGQLMLALQLPDNRFVQTLADIKHNDGRFYELRAEGAQSGDLALLRQSLGQSSGATGRSGGR